MCTIIHNIFFAFKSPFSFDNNYFLVIMFSRWTTIAA